MKTPPVLITFCLAAFAIPAAADTFILKDGTTLEGTVLEETPETYLLEVQVTPTIKDERKVAKADVEKVVAERLDEKAFEEIATLVPTPDLLAAEDYERRIRLVNEFLKAHPKSAKAKEAQEILATLQKEAEAVNAGGMKLNNQIISATEYRANAYEIDAKALETKIREHIAKRELLAALRAFDELGKSFQTTSVYHQLVPAIREVIDQHEARVSKMVADFDAAEKERQVGLDRMSPAVRLRTERALAAEQAVIEARYQEERAARQRWVTPYPHHKASLQDAVRNAQQEARRLSTLRPPTGVDGAEAYRKAWAAIHDEEAEDREISAALSAVRGARLPARYQTMLEDAAKQAKEPEADEAEEGESEAGEVEADAAKEASEAAE